MLDLLVALVIWGLVLAIIWWAVSQIPVPEPFSWVIKVVFALIVVVVLLNLLGVTGGGTLPSLRPLHIGAVN